MKLDHSALPIENPSMTVKNGTPCEGDATNWSRREDQGVTESEQFRRFLAEKTSDLLSVTAVSDQPAYVYLNPSHRKILGLEPREMLGKNPLERIHPEDREKICDLLSRPAQSSDKEPVLVNCPVQKVLFRIRNQAGDYRVLEGTADRLGENYVLLVSKDATEHIRAREKLLEEHETLKQQVLDLKEEIATSKKVLKEEIFKRWRAEEALRKSEEQNKKLLESFEDGFFEVDLAGNLTFFNESLCRLVGYSHQEMMGMNNRQYMTPVTSKKVYETFNEVFRTGKATKAFDWELIRKDGDISHVETSVSPIYGPDGEQVGFRGIARDVTDRERIRQELQTSEEKYRTILQSIEDGYYEVDVAGNMVFFNDSMCRIVGFPPEELKGKNNRDYMTAETAKTVYETFNLVYRTGEPAKVLGWELVRKNGQRRYVETSVSLVRGKKGEPVGFRGVARDVTDQKAMEKARERIINHLSHELGTPLSILEGMLVRMPDEIRKGNLQKLHEWSERGLRNLRRLKDLKNKIDDILNEKSNPEKEGILGMIEGALALLGQLESESLKEGAEALRQRIVEQLESLYKIEETTSEDIRLGSFIDELLQDAASSLKGRQLEILTDFEEGLFLKTDRKVLKKACEGLLRNAIENTPDDGKIEIKARCENDFIRMEFRDFGVGILPENQRMIFGGFFHTQDTNLYASRKPYQFNAGGRGVDLWRTKIFSERHGFYVDVSSLRCRYLPTDKDECPGKISSCPFIQSRNECMSSGSIFSLLFPKAKFVPEKETVA